MVEVLEVGPRDGLQNEPGVIPVHCKLALVERLIVAGSRRLEVASFVNPARVPQMAGAEELVARLPVAAGVIFAGLTLNRRGAERALATGIHELGAVALTTDAFALRNQGQTAEESAVVACEIVEMARRAGRRASVTISAAFGCPFEGEVSLERVVAIARKVAGARPHEIALADTIGVADPWRVADLVKRVRAALPDMPLRAHFHNTRNTGLANAYAAVQAGVTTLDASIGGIGGCPFAPAATGNIATEDLVYMLERGGVETSLSLSALIDTSRWFASVLGKETPALVSKAGEFPNPAKIDPKSSAA